MSMIKFSWKGYGWVPNFSVCWYISQLVGKNVTIFFSELNHTTFTDIETKKYQLSSNGCGMTHPNMNSVKHNILNQNQKIRDFSNPTKQL